MSRLARPRRGRSPTRRGRGRPGTLSAPADALVFHFDGDGRIEDVWPEDAPGLVFPLSAMRGRTLGELGFQKDITAPIDEALDAFRRGERTPRTMSGTHPATGRPYQAVLLPRAPGGTFAGLTIVRRDDVLDRAAAEFVSDERRRYENVYRHAQDCVFIVDVLDDGGFRYMHTNTSYSVQTGIQPEDFWGRRPEEFFAPDLAEALSANYARCRDTGHPIQYEETLTLPIGVRDWLTQLVPIPGADGRIDLIAGIARDITALRAAEKEAYESLRRFKNLHDYNNDSIFWVEVLPEGGFRYTYSNPAHQTKTGLRPEQFWGKRPHEILPPEVADRLTANYARARDAGVPISYEETPYFPTGSNTWLTQLVPIPDADGRIDLIVGIARDITAIRAAERTSDEMRARLDAVLASLDDVAFSVGADRRALHYASPNAERLTGLDPTALLADPSLLRDVLARDDHARLLVEVQHLLGGGELDTDLRLRVGGEWRTVHVRARRIVGPDGAPPRIDGVVSDETARVRVEAEAGHMRSRLDAVVNALDDAVWSIDAGVRHFRFMSRAIEPLLGLPADRVTLGTWLGAIASDDRPAFAAAIRRMWAEGSAEVRFRIEGPGGDVRWLRARGRAVYDGDGRPLRADGVLQDVTEHTLAQGALADARDAAEAATRAKSTFLATMSHEIRTPLNGVIGVADLLRTTPLDAEQREFAETIIQSGHHLLALLNDLLDFSKIEAGRVDLEAIPFDLPSLLRETVRLHEPTARQKGIALTLSFADSPPLVGDPTRLRQILSNLVSNAVKFTGTGHVSLDVRIEATRPGHARLVAEVDDTGTGISPEAMEHIFLPFAQGDSTTTRRYGGTGLGLAISRRLAEAMGGHVHATSTPGVGSRFTVTLPFLVSEAPAPAPSAVPAPAAEPPTAAPGAAPPEPDPTSLRVLVVEDNPVNRAVVKRMLERIGLASVFAPDGEAALACLAQARADDAPIDVVLMDVQMPGLNGLDVTRRLRRSGGPPPYVVAFTAQTRAEDRAAATEAGMDDVLDKPTTLDALRAVLARARAHLGAETA